MSGRYQDSAGHAPIWLVDCYMSTHGCLCSTALPDLTLYSPYEAQDCPWASFERQTPQGVFSLHRHPSEHPLVAGEGTREGWLLVNWALVAPSTTFQPLPL